MYAMGGASPEHNQIVANVVTELNAQLKKRPRIVYPSDLPLRPVPAVSSPLFFHCLLIA
jgi:hypothetical protein